MGPLDPSGLPIPTLYPYGIPSRGLTLCLLDRKNIYILVQILIRNHRKKWQYVGRAKVSTQNAFQRAGPSKWDWLVVFQQSCSITTLVDAITTAWEH